MRRPSCRSLGLTAAAAAATSGGTGGGRGGIAALIIQHVPTVLMIILSPDPDAVPHDHPAPVITIGPVPEPMITIPIPLSSIKSLSSIGPPVPPAFRPPPRHRQGQHYGGWGCGPHLFKTGAPTSRTPAVEAARDGWGGGGRRTADALHLHRKIGAVPNASGRASYLRHHAQQQRRAVAAARGDASSSCSRAHDEELAPKRQAGSRCAAAPPGAPGCCRRGH